MCRFLSNKEINLEIEQCIAMKSLVKMGKTNAEIREPLLSVYGGTTTSCAKFFEWIGRFSEERVRMFDDKWKSRPLTIYLYLD